MPRLAVWPNACAFSGVSMNANRTRISSFLALNTLIVLHRLPRRTGPRWLGPDQSPDVCSRMRVNAAAANATPQRGALR